MRKYIPVLLILNVIISAQDFQFSYEFGNFQRASSFAINPSGNVYIADAELNEIYKFDVSGNEQRSVGGFGWNQSTFDNPAEIYATTLNVVAADKNNNRIQIFDRELNYLTQIQGNSSSSTKEGNNINFGRPVACLISAMGDIFILDSENKQILKFNSSGDYISGFGNYQSGDFALSEPGKMAITSDNKLVVLDNSTLAVFDQYGNGISRIRLDEEVDNIDITDDILILTSNRKVYSSNLYGGDLRITELKLFGADFNDEIVKGAVYKNNLYILTKHQVFVLKK